MCSAQDVQSFCHLPIRPCPYLKHDLLHLRCLTLSCPNKQCAFSDSTLNLSPPLLQLRYLQTLNSIAAEHNSTIIFPMPINLATRLFGRSSAAAEAEEEDAEEEKGKGGAPTSSALSAGQE